jgi:serine/threonine-protein kinase HipA
MVFNVLAANCDDHTKNLSFLMDPDGRWQLTPAYDVTHAYNPRGEWTYQHLMSVNGKFRDITRADLEAVGDRFLVPGYRGIINTAIEAVRQWPEHAAAAGLPASEATRIGEDFPDIR